MVTSAILAYLGPFNQYFRENTVNHFCNYLEQNKYFCNYLEKNKYFLFLNGTGIR